MNGLHDLAEAVGLVRVWHDANGREQVVSDGALVTILTALGYPASSDAEIRASLRTQGEERQQPPTFLSVDVDTPLALPPMLVAASAELHLEQGEVRAVPIADGLLPPIAEPGYHRLRIADQDIALAVAPKRCLSPEDLPGAESGKLWGTAIQIPSLHDAPGAFGDLGDLRGAVMLLAERGADAVAISPVHALNPAKRDGFSPYSPSSRLFLNAALADLPGADSRRQRPAAPGGLDGEPGSDLIDWPGALTERYRALHRSFADLSPERRAEIELWAQEQGPSLYRHAVFDALSLYLHDPDWRRWPIEFRNPDGRAAAQFAVEHAEDVAFHLYAQWLAEGSLAAVQDAAVDAGMAVGLIADLAVGIDPGGSDSWAMQDSVLTGLTIGAPPDPLGPDGQNWQLTAFSPRGLRQSAFAPWIATLRASLRHAGGVRIDHAFGLARLWVVPEGATAAEGAYLTYPLTDLLRVIALESHRGAAPIVGEDLGTRPPGFDAPITEKAILSMRVLWFERDVNGFLPAARFPAQALAMTGTHDTATVAGWWSGHDIDWNRRLGRGGDGTQQETQRMADRAALWSAIAPADAPRPDAHDPAPVVEAAIAHLGRSPCALTIVPLEDLLALEEQPNLPGTIDEHPNWRRRLSAPLADLLAEPATARRIASLIAARSA